MQIGNHVSDVIKIYENICRRLSEQSSKSYIGLRDFYSLIKYLKYVAIDRRSKILNHDVVTGMNIFFKKLSRRYFFQVIYKTLGYQKNILLNVIIEMVKQCKQI